MYDTYREVWRHRAVLPGEAWMHGREMIERPALDHLVAGPPGDDDETLLDVLGEGQPARVPPCGGRCQRFGVQGCHSPRCCVGAE
jgi:hypothetical protein